MSVIAHLQHYFCQKLDDVPSSLMRNHHLVSNKKYTVEWGMLYAPAKMRCHENAFGELVKCSKTPGRLTIQNALKCSTSQETYISLTLCCVLLFSVPVKLGHMGKSLTWIIGNWYITTVEYIKIVHIFNGTVSNRDCDSYKSSHEWNQQINCGKSLQVNKSSLR